MSNLGGCVCRRWNAPFAVGFKRRIAGGSANLRGNGLLGSREDIASGRRARDVFRTLHPEVHPSRVDGLIHGFGRARLAFRNAELLECPDFLDAHPNVELELVGEDRPIDIVEEGFDAGIRLGNFVQIDMVAMWLTPPERFVVVGAPALFRKHGRPASPYDLQDFRCILLRQSVRALDHWQFIVDGERITVGVGGPLVINDIEACIHSALRGVGLFQLPHSLVMSHLERGDLQTVLEPYCEEVPGLSLYYPSRSQSLPKLRAFVDFAIQRMRREFKPGDYLPKPVP